MSRLSRDPRIFRRNRGLFSECPQDPAKYMTLKTRVHRDPGLITPCSCKIPATPDTWYLSGPPAAGYNT